MIAAHISRSAAERKSAIAGFLARSTARQVIYVCPKSILWQAASLPATVSKFSFEDLDKRDVWLTVNALIGPQTALVMECVSRYARITSPKFANLQRLSKQIDDKLLVDHVPLTEGIEYVYTPYSYLDRSILGFADFLLETLPLTAEHKATFVDRFSGQQALEGVYRQQCRQLLINDWENNVPVMKGSEERGAPLKKWMEIL